MTDNRMVLLLGALLLCCAIQDLIKKKVYLWVIGLGAIIIIICILWMDNLDLANRIGGLFIGLSILALSKITAGKIGIGDGLLLCISGLGLGFWPNIELLGMALFLAATLSIVLLIFRKVDHKQSIPFIPFLFVGYLILCIASKGSMA